MLTFLIMAGGTGERFWPLSTREKPKQFLSIFSKKPLIVEAYERVLPLVRNPDQIFISTNNVQVKALKEALPDLKEKNIIIEPVFKDTAAAIGYGSLIISKYFDNPTTAVLASDHLITEPENFRKTLLVAEKEAEKGHMVTLGIKPTYPETGYGYIETPLCKTNVPVKSSGFHEKPNIDLAKEYLESGNYLWNSGMFIFTFSTLFSSFKEFAPEYLPVFEEIDRAILKNEGLKTTNLVKKFFELFPKKSIDFAIMEKSNNVYVVPSSFGWSDVGTFAAFDRLFSSDEFGNVSKGPHAIFVDSSNNILIGDPQGVDTILLGIHDCIVVNTPKGILVSQKASIGDLKKAVERLGGPR
jgi:mannose-1-phosphate guanylyltransferase